VLLALGQLGLECGDLLFDCGHGWQ
jgi:hypothetical protein